MNVKFKYIALLSSILASFLLAACSTTPDKFAQSLSNSPDLDDVLTSGKLYQGQQVRWGGVILSVRNQESSSLIEVLHHPLASSGRPNASDISQGRFFIKVNEFIDPQVYTPKKSITVIGTLSGKKIEKVGEFEYEFPVVNALMGNYRLWKETTTRYYYQADPFYDPYWHRHSYYYRYGPSYYYPRYYHHPRSGGVIRIKTR